MTCTRLAAATPERGLNCLQTRPAPRRRRLSLRAFRGAVALGTAAIGALGCNGATSLAVTGDTPYVRCLAAAAPDVARVQIGPVQVSAQGGVLELSGLPAEVRVAAFAGPGPGPGWPKGGNASEVPALRALAAGKPDMVLVLGDLGDAPELAQTTLAGLDTLGVPVLVLGGGRDTLQSLTGVGGRHHVFDASPYLAVRLAAAGGGRSAPGAPTARGPVSLLPVAGALDGRYARSPQACGYGATDLEARADRLGRPAAGERRLLWAWQAPAGAAPDDAGSPALARFAGTVRAGAGLFAWPHATANRLTSGPNAHPHPLTGVTGAGRVVVPRLIGPALERADGSTVPPGFALCGLGAEGLVLYELRAVPER